MPHQIDIYIGLGALGLIALGYLSGLLRTLISLIWVYICIFIASGFGPAVIAAFSFLSVEESQIGKVVMILAVFVILYLVGELILAMLKNFVSITVLGPLDKVLGGAVAGFKALLVAGFVFEVIFILPLSEETKNNINSSRLKELGTQIFKTTYPLAVALGGRTQELISRQIDSTKITQAPIDIKVVTAEASKVIETVKRVTP
jgi:uncharacterized membrane protein required for colicin V production